jgi:hypothetical protein
MFFMIKGLYIDTYHNQISPNSYLGMLQKIERLLVDVLGETIPAQQESKGKFLELIDNARKGIWIVAGELDGSFYCGTFADKLKNKIDNNSAITIKFLFHKDSNKNTVIASLKAENKKIVSLFLDENYGKHIEFYWAKKRPIYHFVVADTSTLLEEKNHKPGGLRSVYIKKENIPLSTKYIKHFNNMANNHDIVEQLNPSDFK